MLRGARGGVRIGLGYDSHRFEPGRRLILGGIVIPAERGLAGHSDADAVAHALTDAVLGAAGLGDMGRHFPSDDPAWEGADSIELLRRAVTLLSGRGYRVVNADVTVVCEAPRIGPHTEAMSRRLAEALGIESPQVSVKAKSNDGMGWIGRGEGVAALAVTLIDGIDA